MTLLQLHKMFVDAFNQQKQPISNYYTIMQTETDARQLTPSEIGREFIAQHLRKPAGDFVTEIADAMNR